MLAGFPRFEQEQPSLAPKQQDHLRPDWYKYFRNILLYNVQPFGVYFHGRGGESEAGEDLGGSGKGLGKDLGVAGFAEQRYVCDERPALNGG